MTTIILSSVLLLVSILTLALFVKYNKLKNKFNDVTKIVDDLKKPVRRGYIKKDLTSNPTGGAQIKFESFIYVKELDRFTNGESKIEIESIEEGIDDAKVNNKAIVEYINESFISIVKTTDVVWLESEVSIKEMRKNKLAQLEENLKNSQ